MTDHQLRFVIMMILINLNPETDLERKKRLSVETMNTYSKECGIPMHELRSLVEQMTKEAEAITDWGKRKVEELEARQVGI